MLLKVWVSPTTGLLMDFLLLAGELNLTSSSASICCTRRHLMYVWDEHKAFSPVRWFITFHNPHLLAVSGGEPKKKLIRRYAKSNKEKFCCLSELRRKKWTSHEHAEIDSFLSYKSNYFEKVHAARELFVVHFVASFTTSSLYRDEHFRISIYFDVNRDLQTFNMLFMIFFSSSLCSIVLGFMLIPSCIIFHHFFYAIHFVPR